MGKFPGVDHNNSLYSIAFHVYLIQYWD